LSSALDVAKAIPSPLPASTVDYNRRTLIHQVEEFDHVRVTHTHTAMARGRADFILVFRAVNVDEPVPRVRIVLVQSVQP
jgi:hypothetical protein